MKKTVVLAYAGGIHASAAIPWLIDTYGVDVVTLTLDVGQGDEFGELRDRALACGAVRAHVIDCRDDFARDVLLPSLHDHSILDAPRASMSVLPRPLIAKKLVEIAQIEGADTVAHGAGDPSFDAAIAAVNPALRIVAPAREWTMGDGELAAYANSRRLPVRQTPADCRIDQNLWGRAVTWSSAEEPPAARADASTRRLNEPAIVDIHFESGMPTSVNGVPMSAAELIECLSLIGGHHGIGRVHATTDGSRQVVYDMPAAVVLRAAATAAGGRVTTDVRLKLTEGQYEILTASDRNSLQVNYA